MKDEISFIKYELGERVEPIPMIKAAYITIWVEDYCCTLQHPMSTHLLTSEFIKENEKMVPKSMISKAFVIEEKKFFFEGGDIIKCENMIFVGKDSINKNLDDFFKDIVDTPFLNAPESKIVEFFKSAFCSGADMLYTLKCSSIPANSNFTVKLNGNPYVVPLRAVKVKDQPLFHLDMFLTPVGRVKNYEKLVVLVGDVRLADIICQNNNYNEAWYSVFDNLQIFLEEVYNVKVIRIPIYYGLNVLDDGKKTFYWISYNNCLVENSEPPRVFLPQYYSNLNPHLAKLDQVAIKIWDDLGFATTALWDCNPLCINGGFRLL